MPNAEIQKNCHKSLIRKLLERVFPSIFSHLFERKEYECYFRSCKAFRKYFNFQKHSLVSLIFLGRKTDFEPFGFFGTVRLFSRKFNVPTGSPLVFLILSNRKKRFKTFWISFGTMTLKKFHFTKGFLLWFFDVFGKK